MRLRFSPQTDTKDAAKQTGDVSVRQQSVDEAPVAARLATGHAMTAKGAGPVNGVDHLLTEFYRLLALRRRLSVLISVLVPLLLLPMFLGTATVSRMRSDEMEFIRREKSAIDRRIVVERIPPTAEAPKRRQDPKLSTEAAATLEAEEMRWHTKRERLEARIVAMETADTVVAVLSILALLCVLPVGILGERGLRRITVGLSEAGDTRTLAPLLEAIAPAQPQDYSRVARLLNLVPFGAPASANPVLTDTKQRRTIASVVTNIVVSLDNTAVQALGEQERAGLARAMEHLAATDVEGQAPFLGAGLRSFTQMCDGRVAELAERLTRLEGTSPSVVALRESASSTAPLLRRCAEQCREAATLVRASTGFDGAVDHYLRPAAPSAQNDDKSHLRPSDI